MKKNIAILSALSLLAIGADVCAAATAGRDSTIETKTYSCNGYQVKCDFNLNAVGDLFSDRQLGTRGLRVNNLGKITRARKVVVPNFSLGSKALYSFTPTKSFSRSPMDKGVVNQPMQILFAATRKNGKFAVMTFRKLANESKWMEMATTVIGAPQTVDLRVTLNSNGNAVFHEGNTTQTVTLGRVIPAVGR